MTHLPYDLFLEHFLPILCSEMSSFEQSGSLGNSFKTLTQNEGQQFFFQKNSILDTISFHKDPELPP